MPSRGRRESSHCPHIRDAGAGMRRAIYSYVYSVVLLAALLPRLAAAQDAPLPDWRGFYLGYHTGGALALQDVGDPFGASIFGDTVRTPGLLAGGQAGYNWQRGLTVYGLEADASWADMD